MGFLLSFVYGMVLAFAGLFVGDWQFWALLVLYLRADFLDIMKVLVLDWRKYNACL